MLIKLKFEAKEDVQNALETGNIDEAQKMQQRTTHISTAMVEDAKKMIRLMGLPVIEVIFFSIKYSILKNCKYISLFLIGINFGILFYSQAPSEAEAQCAFITRDSADVFASVTEDMDTLTFGTKILLRGLNSKKEPISEINLEEVLKGIICSYLFKFFV